jgi:hypothetical protein
MLESTVDLLNGLFSIALILLMVFSIVGSIVAALRAVSRGTATSTGSQGKFVDDVQPVGRPLGAQVRSVDGVLKPVGPEKVRSSPGSLNTFLRQGTRKPREDDQTDRC